MLRFLVAQNWLTRQWRWKLLAENHKSIAVSGESYHNRQDCIDAIINVRRYAYDAPIVGYAKMKQAA